MEKEQFNTKEYLERALEMVEEAIITADESSIPTNRLVQLKGYLEGGLMAYEITK